MGIRDLFQSVKVQFYCRNSSKDFGKIDYRIGMSQQFHFPHWAVKFTIMRRVKSVKCTLPYTSKYSRIVVIKHS